jgi:hypothetical protein
MTGHGLFIACYERSTGWTLIMGAKSFLCDVRDEECDTKDVIQMACQNIEKESA